MLRGQDVLTLLWLLDAPKPPASVRVLASDLGVSLATAQRALQRLQTVGLYDRSRRAVPRVQAQEFLVHAAHYVVPAARGGETRGIPTAWAAPPLRDALAAIDELPPVWPDSRGTVRGLELQPLHPAALPLAESNPRFYELLALVDALRARSDVRTSRIARDLLAERLHVSAPA